MTDNQVDMSFLLLSNAVFIVFIVAIVMVSISISKLIKRARIRKNIKKIPEIAEYTLHVDKNGYPVCAINEKNNNVIFLQ